MLVTNSAALLASPDSLGNHADARTKTNKFELRYQLPTDDFLWILFNGDDGMASACSGFQ
jgi:hypothetical protein